MTAFRKAIISLSLFFTFFLCVRLQKSDMTIMYPDNCLFTLDHLFSKSMQADIKDFIDETYKKNRVPSDLLPMIESCFPSIKSIVIDMQNPEFLHFKIQAYEPIFLLNNQFVVCSSGNLFSIDVFSQEYVSSLENIVFQQPLTPVNIDLLTKFYQSCPLEILKDFLIRWVNEYTIWLDEKKTLEWSMLVSSEYILTLQDVSWCRMVREQIINSYCKNKLSKLSKSNIAWVFDLRFDQQIVVFSTNKGG